MTAAGLRAASRKLAVGAALGLFTLLITLASGEAFLRGTDLGGLSYFDHARSYHRDALEPDPSGRLRYRHKPGFRARYGRAEVVINSQGLRDEERARAKAPGTFRILVLGDSVPFGWGVPLEQTFTKLMQRDLNAAASSTKFDVINSGVCSWDTRDEVTWFAREGLRYAPDLVLLCFVPNDANTVLAERGAAFSPFAAADAAGGEVGAAIGLLRGSYLARFVHQRAVRPWSDKSDHFNSDSLHWRGCRAWLDRLRQRCLREQLPLVLCGVFSNEGARGRRARARLIEYARETELPFIDCDDFFREVDYRRFVNSPTDSHWNAAGHRRVAEGLGRRLKDDCLLP